MGVKLYFRRSILSHAGGSAEPWRQKQTSAGAYHDIGVPIVSQVYGFIQCLGCTSLCPRNSMLQPNDILCKPYYMFSSYVQEGDSPLQNNVLEIHVFQLGQSFLNYRFLLDDVYPI